MDIHIHKAYVVYHNQCDLTAQSIEMQLCIISQGLHNVRPDCYAVATAPKVTR